MRAEYKCQQQCRCNMIYAPLSLYHKGKDSNPTRLSYINQLVRWILHINENDVHSIKFRSTAAILSGWRDIETTLGTRAILTALCLYCFQRMCMSVTVLIASIPRHVCGLLLQSIFGIRFEFRKTKERSRSYLGFKKK